MRSQWDMDRTDNQACTVVIFGSDGYDGACVIASVWASHAISGKEVTACLYL